MERVAASSSFLNLGLHPRIAHCYKRHMYSAVKSTGPLLLVIVAHVPLDQDLRFKQAGERFLFNASLLLVGTEVGPRPENTK